MTMENQSIQKKMSQCHFVHHTSHVEWPEIRFPSDRLAINCLNHGAAHVLKEESEEQV